MTTENFDRWLAEHSSPEWSWYIKRLSANDTLATGAHQAGPYFPKKVIFSLFPSVHSPQGKNPETSAVARIDSHGGSEYPIRAIWYNQKSRDECRITRWGGKQSPILDPEATGSVCIFAFWQDSGRNTEGCHVWLCSSAEEDLLENRIGPVEPGEPLFLIGGRPSALAIPETTPRSCWLTEKTMPDAWQKNFPSAADIVSKTIALRAAAGRSADDRLMIRRKCEFEMFRSVEHMVVLPRIRQGFSTVDEFIGYSNGVTNRRKSRSGRSLELHLAGIFQEEEVSFSHGEISEGNKKPDFLFPSAEAYRSNKAPLWMLAAKTTCKDRWRQILNEADRVPKKHLITLQEGLSENQFSEMRAAGVSLVVPKPIHSAYPEKIRGELMSLLDFISLVKL